jgi:hypothetical protein
MSSFLIRLVPPCSSSPESMIVDVLDSLLIMGLDDEYARARKWVADNLSFDIDGRSHAFEVHMSYIRTSKSLLNIDLLVCQVTIRVLGGLLSAYHLSGNDSLYLDLATDLGDRLLPIFDTVREYVSPL